VDNPVARSLQRDGSTDDFRSSQPSPSLAETGAGHTPCAAQQPARALSPSTTEALGFTPYQILGEVVCNQITERQDFGAGLFHT